MALATPILRVITVLTSSLVLLAGPPKALADNGTAQAKSAAYFRKKFQEAQVRYRGAPGEAAAAWQFGRACFELAEFPTNRSERASLADEGMAACRLAIARASNSAPAHYYLGLNLGQLARTKGPSALKLVDQMEQAFIRARELDEHLDYAGPDRHLGVLYRDAPSIISIGSRSRARECLQRAVKLAPQYPENGLNLTETYVKWGERADASRELQALTTAWPTAHTNLTGAAWAASWVDWEERLQKLKTKIGQPKPGLGAPHAQP
jgi:tetratricopeptide (TPR) repeat protein